MTSLSSKKSGSCSKLCSSSPFAYSKQMVDSYHYVGKNGKMDKQEIHLQETKNGKSIEKSVKSIKNDIVKEKKIISKDGGKTFKTVLKNLTAKSTLSALKKEKKMTKVKTKKK